MRRTLTLLLVAVWLAALAPAQDKPFTRDDIDKLLSNGVSPLRVSTLVEQEGIAFAPDPDYLRSLELRPDTEKLIETVKAAGARYLRPVAEADLKARNWAQAELHYRALLDLVPADAAAHAGLGTAMVRQGRADSALQEFGKTLASDPGNVAAHRGMGMALFLRKDNAGALAELTKARTLDPNDAVTHAALGDVLLEQGDADGAVLEYSQAQRLDPALESPRVGLARAYEKKGDLPGAELAFRNLLAQDPRDPRANFGLARVLEKKGSNQEALNFYRVAYTSEPTNTAYRDAYEHMVALTMNVNVTVNQAPPKPAFGLIHVYRPSRFVGSLGVLTITLDGRPVARLGNGRNFTLRVPAGSHFLAGERIQAFTLVVQPDQEYYLSFELGMFQNSFKAQPPAAGARGLGATRSIEPDRILDASTVVEGGATGAEPGIMKNAK